MQSPWTREPAEQASHTYMSEHSEQFGIQALQLGGFLAG